MDTAPQSPHEHDTSVPLTSASIDMGDWHRRYVEEDRRIAERLTSAGLHRRQSPRTPREVAEDLIMQYVARGDDVEQLAHGGMGAHSMEWEAQIGGYVRSEDNTQLIRKIDCWHIGVTRVGGVWCCEVFSLRQVYDDLYQRIFVARQLPLFEAAV